MRKVARLALSSLGYEGAEIGIIITGDRRMRTLNREYRGMDRTTDVLSFGVPGPAGASGTVQPRRPGGRRAAKTPPLILGDIAISAPKAKAQAEKAGHSVSCEMLFLLVHGVLHLAGYDHEEDGERRLMERKQRWLMKKVTAR
ncbi:MAG: rRNA maturation RNase YbeY [Nitrospirota bacterium]